MTRHMVKGSIPVVTEPSMKENGNLICNTGTVMSIGLMVLIMRVTTQRGSNMVEASYFLQMDPSMKENSSKGL